MRGFGRDAAQGRGTQPPSRPAQESNAWAAGMLLRLVGLLNCCEEFDVAILSE